MNQAIRLWELSEGIQQLENAITFIQEDDTLTDNDREAKLEETFNQWIEVGESFND